jgi:hypothetical protein
MGGTFNGQRRHITGIDMPTAVVHGQKSVTTVGTRVTLGSTTSLKFGVTIKAKVGNTGSIYVGSSAVTSSNGYVLAAGESVFVGVADLASIYIDSSVNGEGVSFVGS